MRRSKRIGWLGVVGLVGCSTADPAARVAPRGPDRTQFALVAPVLVRQCGTLDCHGAPARNLRLYGYGGLRLREGQLPDDGDTLPEEVSANYDAVVGLEPEELTRVVGARGAGREDLTFVRKARGIDHKGGAAVTAGDSADRCILSWLALSVDADACLQALPPTDAGVRD